MSKKKVKKVHLELSHLPLSIFKDRSISVLEAIVEYLHEAKNLSFKQIALLLNRNERTIWTVYDRVRKKRARQFK
ncbi:MAG: hypothetical protein KKH52_02535 [Nanoarchaeota archaeon]|nr:hypothetical protein [Nanoarchaeota archaeon]MBU1974250.1 hypothetical protein [Nanoarchaeota archaeon]